MRSAICALCLAFTMGCGTAEVASLDGGTGAGITISGKLVVGAQPVVPPPPIPPYSPPPPPPAPAPGDPLVGYQPNCVTFATPPTATSATADAEGHVTLDLEDPTNPVVIDAYRPPYWARDVAVIGNCAFVAELLYGNRGRLHCVKMCNR